jgi:hypothetical protein
VHASSILKEIGLCPLCENLLRQTICLTTEPEQWLKNDISNFSGLEVMKENEGLNFNF